MALGYWRDLVAGQLSRILHGLRGPKVNTVSDLAPYLDKPLSEFFPEPPSLENVRVRKFPGSAVDSHHHAVVQSSTHVPLSLNYRARHEHQYRANHTAWARWVRPDGERRRDCLVYIHGWLEPGSWVEEALMFPTWTRELDVDVVHIALPFPRQEKPEGGVVLRGVFLDGRSRAVIRRRAAGNSRRAVAHGLVATTEVTERVGVTGVSLGGSLAMLLGCLSPLPDYLIPIVAPFAARGGRRVHASILWRLKSDLDRWGIHERERRRIFARVGWDTAKPLLSPERQLWIEAREDAHIDPNLVREQWEEVGSPEHSLVAGRAHDVFPPSPRRESPRAMKEFMRRTQPRQSHRAPPRTRASVLRATWGRRSKAWARDRGSASFIPQSDPPPSTQMVSPVMKSPAGDSKYATAQAISSERPSRFVAAISPARARASPADSCAFRWRE